MYKKQWMFAEFVVQIVDGISDSYVSSKTSRMTIKPLTLDTELVITSELFKRTDMTHKTSIFLRYYTVENERRVPTSGVADWSITMSVGSTLLAQGPDVAEENHDGQEDRPMEKLCRFDHAFHKMPSNEIPLKKGSCTCLWKCGHTLDDSQIKPEYDKWSINHRYAIHLVTVLK